MGEGLIMTLDEKINQLEKRITELSQPPVQHEDIELTISTENCETHGPFECRTRHFLNSRALSLRQNVTIVVTVTMVVTVSLRW